MPRSEPRERGAALDAATEGAAAARPITDRQLEILRNVARGKTNREIGEDLGISERTVRNHMRSISQRLASSDRTHAVVIAIGNGWIPIPIQPEGTAALPAASAGEEEPDPPLASVAQVRPAGAD